MGNKKEKIKNMLMGLIVFSMIYFIMISMFILNGETVIK